MFTTSWYTVVETSFFIVLSCLKVWVCSCPVGYAFAQSGMQLPSWVCSRTDGYAVAVRYAVAQLGIQSHRWVCRCTVGYAVVQFSVTWVCSCTVLLPGYAVVQFSVTWVCSCTVFYYLGMQLYSFLLPGYAVAQFSINWVQSCTVFYYLGMQLHGVSVNLILWIGWNKCKCISFSATAYPDTATTYLSDVPNPTPWYLIWKNDEYQQH